MNIAGLNALADVILAAQKNDRTPMGIAFSIASAGHHLTPEVKAELERLRLLQNAQPAELSEAQLEALIDAGNGALNEYYHERACSCSSWPESCASSGDYFTGYWDTDAFAIGAAAVVGMWESMRAPTEADEIARLRKRVAELEAESVGLREVIATAIEQRGAAFLPGHPVWPYVAVFAELARGREVPPQSPPCGRAMATGKACPDHPRLVEPPHEGPEPHNYRLGRDLPEARNV